MKILVLCDEGNNRSVMIAHLLKYWGHDILAAGVKRNSPATLDMLVEWADRIITTEEGQLEGEKVQLWNIGPDHYPRPFNRYLLRIVQDMMQEHKLEYKETK